MIDLVRKRHDGDGWIVFEEVGDKPGIYRDRTADALALGVWASKKYEAHLYEFKISREDVKRELRDPSKVEGVGKYCTYWWLAISDAKIINEIIVPEAWGIVVKKPWGDKGEFRLHTLRKAPRQKPAPIGVMFAVSLIRNMRKNYIDPSAHKLVVEELYQIKHGAKDAQEVDLKHEIDKLKREKRRTLEMVERFEKAAGVSLGEPSWEYGNIGKAVQVALDMRERIDTGAIGTDIACLSNAAEELERRAKEIARGAVALRELVGLKECTARCRSQSKWRGRCDCGVVPLSEVEKRLARDAQISSSSSTPSPADIHTDAAPPAAQGRSDDDEGSGVDRGDAGTPEQDAGIQLRDQRAEVPHGEPAS